MGNLPATERYVSELNRGHALCSAAALPSHPSPATERDDSSADPTTIAAAGGRASSTDGRNGEAVAKVSALSDKLAMLHTQVVQLTGLIDELSRHPELPSARKADVAAATSQVHALQDRMRAIERRKQHTLEALDGAADNLCDDMPPLQAIPAAP